MVVSIGQLKCDPGNADRLEKMADDAHAAMSRSKGFESATFFIDRAGGAGGALSHRETREDADAFAAASASRLYEAFGDILRGEPAAATYEACQPKQ